MAGKKVRHSTEFEEPEQEIPAVQGFFDWDALDRAEAKQRTRSLPARLRQRGSRRERLPVDHPQLMSSNTASIVEVEEAEPIFSDEDVPEGETMKGVLDKSDEQGSRRPRLSESAQGFKAYLEQRDPFLRLSAGGSRNRPSSSPSLSSGVAWDFPLAKCEKRELLLLHVAAGERLAALDAAEARAEAELLRQQQAEQQRWLQKIRKSNKGERPTQRGFQQFLQQQASVEEISKSQREEGYCSTGGSRIVTAGGC